MRLLMIAVVTLGLGFSTAFAGRLDGLEPAKTQPDINYRLQGEGFSRVDELGFVLCPTMQEEIYDLYGNYMRSSSTPMFISADLPYHTLHLMVDYTVRIMELEQLLPKLEELTEGMLAQAKLDYEESEGDLKEAARAEFIYFAVAASLLELDVEISDEDAEIVEEELKKIEEHEGLDDVKFLPEVKEDYSQYVPRGHYTRSEEFRRYFKAMMWFGRLPLHIPKENKPVLPMQTALLISLNLANNGELNSLWKNIYEPTAFFFGYADDLTPGQLIDAADDFYKEKLEPDVFADKAKLRDFAAELRKDYKPMILSEFALSSGEEQIDIPLSMRFMPQRFIPDSYIFSQLTFDRVTEYTAETNRKPFTWGMTLVGAVRVFPRGLDAMGVLGWDIAESILRKDGDTEYMGYDEQFEKMVKWYAGLPDTERESSIYFRWFELFRLYRKARAPKKVDENAWERKKLLTALGSWTELRHDAILYAKQSYTAVGTAAPPPPLRLAYVEEAPELYTAMAECARVIAGFAEEGGEIEGAYERFAEILDELAALSQKQLKGQTLSAEEHSFLWYVSSDLGSLPYKLGNVVLSDADQRMALIADVHTDLNSGQVLEEATGSPAQIFVLVEIEGKPYVAQGGTFTYYEFKQDMADRLTDEAWQQMILEGKVPEMPTWTEVIFAE
ncbi:DUF3160 domain-containing protein [candidate division WOR-3 bacterium]|uniref:DUF3160 domain-containing protein n=1 Tax=candidate division WOR-3 bacterium TaxID=2052148 RepID=A0A9D5K9M0_UNCW3|nr:DUF3160 domain-containing protein [candidate division WOR-3 bacterium]MBD3364144.1 DUF3160 domain-containing protein [candidate division WOR-3 bacterium]